MYKKQLHHSRNVSTLQLSLGQRVFGFIEALYLKGTLNRL